MMKNSSNSSTMEPVKIKKNTNSLIINNFYEPRNLIDNLNNVGLFEKNEYLGEQIRVNIIMKGIKKDNLDDDSDSEKEDHIEYSNNINQNLCNCYESKNKILLAIRIADNLVDDFDVDELFMPFKFIFNLVKNKEIIILLINEDINEHIRIYKYNVETIKNSDIFNIVYSKVNKYIFY